MIRLALILALWQSPDTTCLRVGRVAVDSLAKLHLKSTTLTAYQARNLRTLDSLHVARCVTAAPLPPAHPQDTPGIDSTRPAEISLGFDYTTTVSWPGGRVGSLTPPMPSLLCAKVEVSGTTYLADRAVLATAISQDSIAYMPATFPSSTALRAACAPLFPGDPVAAWGVWRTLWSSQRIAISTVAVPVAAGQRP